MLRYLPFILFTVLTNAAAQVMLKHGINSLGTVEFSSDTVIQRMFLIVFQPWVLAGLVVFAISMISHLFVLSRVELSFAYPFLSLAYVAVAIFAFYFLGEDLNAIRIGGIVLICLGTILIAQSGAESEHAPITKKSDDLSRKADPCDIFSSAETGSSVATSLKNSSPTEKMSSSRTS